MEQGNGGTPIRSLADTVPVATHVHAPPLRRSFANSFNTSSMLADYTVGAAPGSALAMRALVTATSPPKLLSDHVDRAIRDLLPSAISPPFESLTVRHFPTVSVLAAVDHLSSRGKPLGNASC